MIVTVIWFPCCRILGLNIIWKTVDLHQRELLTRYMKTQQQLMSTWLLQICQMYYSWPGFKYSPSLYLSTLFLIKTVMSFINLNLVSHSLFVFPGGYYLNRCYKLYRPRRTIWCWGFWFSKWLYKIDEVRFFYNFILPSASMQRIFMQVDLFMSCNCAN